MRKRNELHGIMGVYAIKNTVNNCVYVGSALDIWGRFQRHKTDLKKDRHVCRGLQELYNTMGLEVLNLVLLERCKQPMLLEREQYYLNTVKPLYNSSPTAGSTKGLKLSEAIKLQMSVSRKGKQNTAMLGKKHTDSTKELIADKAKQRGVSRALVEAARLANTGRVHTQEERFKIAQKQAKLSLSQVIEIKNLLKESVPQKQIASKYGVAQKVISNIKLDVGYYGQIYKSLRAGS